MALKGCWTCKDRKVSCDRAVPVCLKCSKTKRACGGYGLRLSWPQQHDQKRALLGSTIPKIKHDFYQQWSRQWVNASLIDVRLHLLATSANGGAWKLVDRDQLTFLEIPDAIISMPRAIAASDMDLLYYFDTVLSDILPMLGSERTRIRRLLMQMALSNRSQSSKAVLLALLALASRHRGGNQAYAAQMKHTAVQTLINSTRSDMDATEGVEHIAAGLILSVIEQLYRNFGWIGHVCGAKEVIHAVQQEVHLPGSDAAVILGWVYYFDVLARFSFRHWRTDMIRATAQGLGFKAANTQCLIQYLIARTSFTTKVPTMSAHAHPLIPLLAEVLDTRLYSSDPNYHTTQYQEYLNDLSSRLSNVRIAPQDNGQYGNTCKSLELTRLASLVYHERVSRNFSGQSTRLSAWTKHARLILVSLDIFPPPFSLFVLGCEAHTDQHRMLFLDLFTRLERGPHLNSLPDVKGMIQTAWIQKDLEVDGELEYIHMINLVLSSRNAIPSFM